MESFTFTVSWDTNLQGTLECLIVDGKRLEPAALQGVLGLSYTGETPNGPLHTFEWTVLFPGGEVKNLKARAKVHGVTKVLDKAEKKKHTWHSQGSWS